MTRETKIGLLVGLAFIIVIGILLSDHLTVTTEPPQAALVQAGPNVRQGLTVPAVSNASIAPRTPAYGEVIPQQTVLTQQELRQPLPPQALDIRISAAQGQPQQIAQTQTHTPTYTTEQYAVNQPAGNPVAQVILPTDLNNQQMPLPLPGNIESTQLQQLAQSHGEQLISITPDNNTGRTTQQTAQQSNTIAAREYTAAAGDSLSKIAAKFYGTSTKDTRDLIVRANPSLKDNPNLIISGRSYLIPDRKVTTTPPSVGELALRPVAQQPKPERTAAVDQYTYTVKPGDNLWKIAEEQLGSGKEAKTIMALNKQTLGGTDVVKVGMTLKLPGKALSRAD